MLNPFRRRSPRRTYLFWTMVAAVIGGGADAAIQSDDWLLWLAALLLVLPASVAVTIGRLHDLDRSGWWLLVGLIPIVNLAFGIYLLVAPGTAGSNRFGPDPRGEPVEDWDGIDPEWVDRGPMRPWFRDWDGGAVRVCASCGLANPTARHRCEECGASLSGTMPFQPEPPS